MWNGTSVPLPGPVPPRHTRRVITNVLIHLVNDLPIVVDLEALPAGGDRTVRCTNVRTVDGKRPAFIHDGRSTFVLPLDVIRLIEVPVNGGSADGTPAEGSIEASRATQPAPAEAPKEPDAEPDEDLLARIRSV